NSEALDRQLASMDQLVGMIADGTLETVKRNRSSIKEFADYAAGQEEEFMNRFSEMQGVFWAGYDGEKGLIKAMRGEAFLGQLAYHELVKAAQNAGVDLWSLDDAEVEGLYRKVRAYFSAPLWLFVDIMAR